MKHKLPDSILNHPLPNDLPQCKCFQTSKEHSWQRCSDVANINASMCGAFAQLAEHEQLCPTALMFALESTLTTLLAYVAKANNPDKPYGGPEIEAESLHLLRGLETRMHTRIENVYALARNLGLTEENMIIMREAEGQTKQ